MSLGFNRAGFHTLAAIDIEPKALEVLRANLTDVEFTFCEDLTQFKPVDFANRTGISSVDVIVGGPPCQGYSQVRQRDGSNNGARLVHDNRRTLYRDFLDYVEYFRPAIFLMENVVGMRSAEGGRHYDDMLDESREIGYEVEAGIVQASDFGVPQSRRRLLLIGVRNDASTIAQDIGNEVFNRGRGPSEIVSLWEAIGDLPPLEAGDGQDPTHFDDQRRTIHRSQYPQSEFSRRIKDSDRLTAHVSRPHNDRDLRDFARLREGENSKQALQRGVEMEFPYNRDVFTDKYTRLAKDRPSRSILAHMSKDGLMYIHPDQVRSLTPREAARLQTFPDSFHFPVTRTHQFSLIGNAVPPLLVESIAKSIKHRLRGAPAGSNVALY